jgi:hypothetical protein
MIITEFMENGALDAFLKVSWEGNVSWGPVPWEEG